MADHHAPNAQSSKPSSADPQIAARSKYQETPKTVVIAVSDQSPTAETSIMSADRLRPLTPMYNRSYVGSMSHQTQDPVFTTSPAASEPTSPALHPVHIQPHHIQITPARTPRSTRDRAGSQSRSSSLPSGLRIKPERFTSSPLSSGRNTPHPRGRGSVRHLTCFWWKEKGHCRLSDEDCLYAHYDTGHYTNPPRQVVPGQPALAGRNLDRTLRNLHKSSGSLASLNSSRPVTPGSIDGQHITASGNMDSEVHGLEVIRLRKDNTFLHNLAEQNAREKSVLISSLESLQAENKGTTVT